MDFITKLWTTHSAEILSLSYNLLLSALIVAGSVGISKAASRAVSSAEKRISRLDPTLVPIIKTVLTYLIFTVGGVFVLDIFGVNTTSIIALLGAAGLAIGLALKDTLSNIAAGIMLLFLRPFKTGDYVEIGSVAGTVKEVNLFTSIFEAVNGLYISTPNSQIWGSSITNYTRNGKRRIDIIIGISYSDSIDKGLEILKLITQNETRFLKDPEPIVMVSSLGDNSVNLQLRGWTKFEDYWPTYWELNKLCKEQIEAAGLSIPFPQRTVHIVTQNT